MNLRHCDQTLCAKEFCCTLFNLIKRTLKSFISDFYYPNEKTVILYVAFLSLCVRVCLIYFSSPVLFIVAGVLGREVKDIPLEQLNINFEQFCAIVAEFKCCESETHRLWELVLAKTTRLLQTIVSPLTKVIGILCVTCPHRDLTPFIC